MIRKFRIFLNPIEGQEKWLNEKAIEGLKLSKVGRFFMSSRNVDLMNINMQ